MDYYCRRKKGNGADCFHILTFHWEEGVEDCWFWQHKEGLKPFEWTKSIHWDTVKCSHSNGDHKLSLGGNQRWRFIWNPGFCGQIEGERIRAGISDSSCLLPYCHFRLNSSNMTSQLAFQTNTLPASLHWNCLWLLSTLASDIKT